MRPLLRAVALALPIASSCALFGKKDEPPPPLVQPAQGEVDPASMTRAKRDGLSLYWREHAMSVAVQKGLARVGRTRDAILMPVAEVDEGYHAASVTFYRWPEAEPGTTPIAKEAQRWLVVPLLLSPDRVLENELFSDYLEERSNRAREIDAVVAAGASLLEAHPGGRWHMHPVREGTDKNPQQLLRTRVYAWAVDDQTPDVEVVVDDAPRNGEAKVLEQRVIHAAGSWTADPLPLSVAAPTALTVARIISRKAMARSFVTISPEGRRFGIDAETGAIEDLGVDEDFEGGTVPPPPEPAGAGDATAPTGEAAAPTGASTGGAVPPA